jgi:ribosomal protein L37AE/L43A
MCDRVAPRKRKEATRMRSILSSAKRVVLECGACEERTVLRGPTEVWLSGPADFECGGCGRMLTLADKLDAEGPGAERAGGSRRPNRGTRGGVG